METKNLRIKTNTQGQKIIEALCDIALKKHGLELMPSLAVVLHSIDLDNEYFEEMEKLKKAEAEKKPKDTKEKI